MKNLSPKKKQKLMLEYKEKYPDVITCENCIGVWEIPNKYDHCPICKVQCFTYMTRTQAVHHIYDCYTLTQESKT